VPGGTPSRPWTVVERARRLRAERPTQTVDALLGTAGHWLEASARESPMAWNLSRWMSARSARAERRRAVVGSV
jgi:hypothetical protein